MAGEIAGIQEAASGWAKGHGCRDITACNATPFNAFMAGVLTERQRGQCGSAPSEPSCGIGPSCVNNLGTSPHALRPNCRIAERCPVVDAGEECVNGVITHWRLPDCRPGKMTTPAIHRLWPPISIEHGMGSSVKLRCTEPGCKMWQEWHRTDSNAINAIVAFAAEHAHGGPLAP